MQELGQEVDFKFWGLSGKIHILPLQNCAVCRNTKMSETRLVLLNKPAFPQRPALSVEPLLFLRLRSASHSWCAVTLHKLTLKHWKLLLWLLGVFWGVISTFCSGVLPSLAAFGGMRDTAQRSLFEKFRMCCGASPPCSQCGRTSSPGSLWEHGYGMEHGYGTEHGCGTEHGYGTEHE